MVKSANSILQATESSVIHEGLIEADLPETDEASSPTCSGKRGTMMSQLCDIESSYAEPEKPLPLDLCLDQIEDCRE